jgi:hypothetical protein
MDGSGITLPPTMPGLPPQSIDRLHMHLYRFDRAARAHRIWAEGARKCVNFYEGQQWTQAEIEAFEADDRPYLTINKIARLIRLVLGYQRQNRREPICTPDNDAQASADTAQILSHMLKNSLDDNKFKWTESRVFEDGITTGRGYLDARLSFADNLLGDASIIDLDPFATFPDPDGQTYDASDWSYWFHTSWMSLQQILQLFGIEAMERAKAHSQGGTNSQMVLSEDAAMDDPSPPRYFGLYSWFDEAARNGRYQNMETMFGAPFAMQEFYDTAQKCIRVIDGQHRMFKRVKYFVDTETMAMAEISDSWDAERIDRCMAWAAQNGRQMTILNRTERRVRWIISAGDVLLFDEWSPYKDFTIVPFFPYFRRGMTRGMIEDLIDPQREINKRRSAQIHIIGTTANSGWTFEEGSLDDAEENNLMENGSAPGIIIKYRMGKNAPERIEPANAPTALERLEKAASDDLTQVSGINESALGELDVVQSGVAVKNRQQQTIVGLEPPLDNQDLTRTLLGEKLVYLFQTFYTEPRFYRVTGIDGKPLEFTINQVAAVDSILNDVTMGKYKVTVNSVPAADSFNDRQFNQLKDMVQLQIIPPVVAAGPMIDLSNIPDKGNIKAQTMQVLSMLPPMPAPAGSPPKPGA